MFYSITFKWVVATTGLHFQERNVSENLVREKKKKKNKHKSKSKTLKTSTLHQIQYLPYFELIYEIVYQTRLYKTPFYQTVSMAMFGNSGRIGLCKSQKNFLKINPNIFIFLYHINHILSFFK